MQGKPLGFTVADIRQSGDSVVYAERSKLGGGAFEQQTTVVFSATDASARRLDQVMTRQGVKGEAHLIYAGGRVKGKSVVPQADRTPQGFPVDTADRPRVAFEERASLFQRTPAPAAPA